MTICEMCASGKCPYIEDNPEDIPKIRAIEAKGKCEWFEELAPSYLEELKKKEREGKK